MSALEKIYTQLVEGKRQWTLNEVAGGSSSLFQSGILQPIQELKEMGVICDYGTHTGSYRGSRLIDMVRIIGDIKIPEEEGFDDGEN